MGKVIPSIKIAPMDPFTVIGMSCVTSKEQERKGGKIIKLFSSFSKRSNEIHNTVNHRTLGINIYPKDYSGFEKYEFLAGYQVSDTEKVPEGMTVQTFPAYQYAVITHKGSIKYLFDAYGYFHSKWLPTSGYEYADSFDVQVYDSRFLGPDHPESEMDIYIPIRPASNRAIFHPKTPIERYVQSIFIPVRDIQTSKSWYSRILGLPETWEVVNGHLYMLPVEGPNVILDQMPMWGGKTLEGPPTYKTPALMLPTSNIKDAFQFMQKLDVDIVTEIEDNKWFVFRDPDGNHLMICESTP